ncbi:hypothetical protein PDN20_29905 [Bacillus cereus]|nr:hypothetical protein [Bacillus cereus]MDA2130427.1 hypothetical protein [Bacillus cereus]MDA2152785.1 hypothetical protein [Bacillus cereus]
MAYKLTLVPGVLSYSGLVNASRQQPLVSVDSEEMADAVVKTGYFKLVNNDHEGLEIDGAEVLSISNYEVHTEASLKKLSKIEQEAIIATLYKGNQIPTTKNEQERITLILKLQKEQE